MVLYVIQYLWKLATIIKFYNRIVHNHNLQIYLSIILLIVIFFFNLFTNIRYFLYQIKYICFNIHHNPGHPLRYVRTKIQLTNVVLDGNNALEKYTIFYTFEIVQLGWIAITIHKYGLIFTNMNIFGITKSISFWH